jgi:hypothetical protein
MNTRAHRSGSLLGGLVVALALSGPATGLESPPAGTPPAAFARLDQECLGPLRSAIARGELPALAEGFSGSFNPGGHFGTVAEAQFLASVLGLPLSSPPTEAELEALNTACQSLVP